ncbi:2OG-Fe(II) oxygenase [Gammaproteobacteria bacterium]|nr:2OG-Fe(II) oxygenase [Gammaproteobacteria bacterium]
MNIKEFPKKIAENVILYSPDPILYLVKAFISKEECQAFIKQFDNQLGTDSIKTSHSKKSILDNNTNHCFIDHNVDEILHDLSKRLSILAQIPIRNAEPYELIHYEKGEEPKLSFEAFDIDCVRDKKKLIRGGQRNLSTIFFLNEIDEGSGIVFPKLQITIPAKQGDVLVLHNTIETSHQQEHPIIHPNSIHAAFTVHSERQLIGYLRFRENLLY